MVAPWIEESLVHSSSNKMLVHQIRYSHSLRSKSVIERVKVIFQPKGIFSFCVSVRIPSQLTWLEVKRIGVWAVNYWFGTRINWTSFRPYGPCKPIIPVFEAPMRFTFVNKVVIVVNISLSLFAEPPIRLIFIHVFQRGLRGKHNIVIIENLLQMLINDFTSEKWLSKLTV